MYRESRWIHRKMCVSSFHWLFLQKLRLISVYLKYSIKCRCYQSIPSYWCDSRIKVTRYRFRISQFWTSFSIYCSPAIFTVYHFGLSKSLHFWSRYCQKQHWIANIQNRLFFVFPLPPTHTHKPSFLKINSFKNPSKKYWRTFEDFSKVCLKLRRFLECLPKTFKVPWTIVLNFEDLWSNTKYDYTQQFGYIFWNKLMY